MSMCIFPQLCFVHIAVGLWSSLSSGDPPYTAEFLPIISPLRECTNRPSNSMVEFCLMLPVGVRSGSFSSLRKSRGNGNWL